MKVNQELIEKYHRQECSPEDAEAVEEWLFSGESDEALQLPIGENKAAHKQVIWKEIQSILPKEKPVPAKKHALTIAFWSGAIAASVALILVSFAFYKIHLKNTGKDMQMVSVSNNSAFNVKNVESNDYDISLAPKTSATINRLNGVIDLSGSIMIKPTKDVELSFGQGYDKIVFKTGESYIVLNDMESHGRIIIVNERNLMDLPPVLQKQIINQFKI